MIPKNKKALTALAMVVAVILGPRHAHGQTTIEVTSCGFGGAFTVVIKMKNWRALDSSSVLTSMLDQGFTALRSKCANEPDWVRYNLPVFATILKPPYRQYLDVLIAANNTKSGGAWDVKKNEVANAERQERYEAQEKQKAEAAQAALKAEAGAREVRKKAATADCSGGTKLSGGPWFSSTYSVAASDEARRLTSRDSGSLFCVKTVEYVSAAPNPFGGSAARARFTGYNASDFKPVVVVRDFAY